MQSVYCRLAAACLLCLASASAAWAQARIEDCEKIQAADAYNQCLAKFGPTSKVKSVEPLKPGDIKDNGAEAAAGVTPKGRGGAKVSARGGRHGHGRVAHGHGRHVATKKTGHRSARPASGRKRMTIVVKRHR